MHTLKRILILGSLSLLIGTFVNQFHNRGIKWYILQLTMITIPGGSECVTISADSAFFRFIQKSAVFIDVRTSDEFGVDHIPGALSLPFFSFFNNHDQFKQEDKNTTYILYCFRSDCYHARLMANHLERSGFNHVMILKQGFSAWLEMGYPNKKGANQ